MDWGLGISLAPFDADLALAQQLADAAGAVSLSYFRRELQSWSKEDGSLATEADLAVEDELRTRLKLERLNDAVLGEERGQTGSGRRRWILDGIDGTVDFAAGSPNWATLIALEADGRIVVSVCDEPAHQRRYWAMRGGGAFCSHVPFFDQKQLNVSTIRDLATARSYVPPPMRLRDDRARRVADIVSRSTTPRSHADHPALLVAMGGSELALFLTGGPWDLAGPSLIVEEAGGRFTDLAGKYDLTSGTAIFSNGFLHDDIVRLCVERS